MIGGGVAGLTFALAAARRGAGVTVFEQAEALGDVGAGLQLSPNAMRVFAALGLSTAKDLPANRPGHVEICDMRTGWPLMQQIHGAPGGHPYLQTHRADLIGHLADAVKAAEGAVELGTAVSAGGRNINGRVFDHVVTANGVRGRTNRAAARFTGQVAWRALVPGQGEPTHTRVYIGPGRHMVTYPLRGGDLINLVGVQNEQDWQGEGWDHDGSADDFRAAFSPACDDLTSLLTRVQQVRRWALFAHEEVAMTTPEGRPIIGDAAQTMLPFVAQGAAMAVEDAWSLAAALDGACGLEEWSLRRADRRAAVMRAALANGRVFHEARPWFLPFHRLGMWGLGKIWPGFGATRLKWLYDYDVVSDFGGPIPNVKEP